MSRAVEILVAGAGPTGLALALQAQAHGARVRVAERRPELFRPSRALIMYPRTLETLRPLGVADALLAKADTAPAVCLHVGSRTVPAYLAALDLADTAFPHLSMIRQTDVEAVLGRALAERGVAIERGTELVDVEDGVDGAHATVRTASGVERFDCDFVAGCDGQESIVRRRAGIDWRGAQYRDEVVLADLELDADLAGGVAHAVVGRRGLLFLFALGEQATWRLLATVPAGRDRLPFGRPGPPVPAEELQALIDQSGLPARIRETAWSGRFRLQHRLAARFRQGRLFIAGDAAHAHSPATGQGMNTGIQDAANLGWKLAFAAAATDCAALLDSYERERRPRDRRVLALTHLAFWGEASRGPLPSLVRGLLAPLGAPAVPLLLRQRRLIALGIGAISQLRAPYRRSPIASEGTPPMRRGPRPGERLPDAPVTSGGRRVRLHALLAEPGVHVLLQRDADPIDRLDFGPHVRVRRLAGAPGRGFFAVRPDGYLGFRCGTADAAQLRAWLARIGAVTPADAGD